VLTKVLTALSMFQCMLSCRCHIVSVEGPSRVIDSVKTNVVYSVQQDIVVVVKRFVTLCVMYR